MNFGDMSLGDRMKLYEKVSSNTLVPKMPVVGRIDGKAFHTFCKGMDKPWDRRMQECMWATAEYLYNNIQGCQLAYIQSDEINLLLTDYENFRAEPWFRYKTQKLASVAASLATAKFNQQFIIYFSDIYDKPWNANLAHFDARFFNLPQQEVCNYFIWRQLDAVRNSISGLAQSKFSHKELQGKSQAEMQEMLFQAHGINWNNCKAAEKRGLCIKEGTRDTEIPIFTANRNYIDELVYYGEEEDSS